MFRTLAGLAFASVILTGQAPAAQAQRPDSLMRVIRARYERITGDASHYTQYVVSGDSLGLERWAAGRGHFTASFEGDTLRTIVAAYVGARGPVTEAYTFWDGAPIEIRVKLLNENDHAVEQRFYFNRGYLVRWVDPGHTIHPVTTGAVFARAMQLMADATRLVDAARRTRDHTATPPTPAEVADVMRRELRGLMTAEMEYYTETNTYANDVIAVGYHPVPAVQITLIDATQRGWAARATTASLPGKSCVVFLGHPKKVPKTAIDRAHPDAEREVACDHP